MRVEPCEVVMGWGGELLGAPKPVLRDPMCVSRLPFGLHRGGQGEMDTLLTRFCQEFVGSVRPMLELLQGAAEAVATAP